jgi:hypothetical protein
VNFVLACCGDDHVLDIVSGEIMPGTIGIAAAQQIVVKA